MRYLSNCHDWIGDTLFASSVAKRLKEREPDCYVAIHSPLIQPLKLLQQNPYIDEVITDNPASHEIFNVWFEMPVIKSKATPVTIQYQRACGIHAPSLPFDVYTIPKYDEEYAEILKGVREHHKKPIVCYQGNWDHKSKLFTEIGYFAHRHTWPSRDINSILHKLEPHMTLIQAGFPEEFHQRSAVAHNAESYAQTASIIKNADFMIGAEGGLTNLASAVGTRCIITTDHHWAMFGPNGIMSQEETLAMGPATYYPNGGHTHLSPYLTDDEVADQIIQIVTNAN